MAIVSASSFAIHRHKQRFVYLPVWLAALQLSQPLFSGEVHAVAAWAQVSIG